MHPQPHPPNGKKFFSRILVTNDDGIDAPGLKILEDFARQLADEVWVFAPDDNRSGSGRSLTIARDLRVVEEGTYRYSCDGTPTDCVILALNHFMKDHRPDLVLSGINLGMNVADDITCSGTIGGAWEACVHTIPAIAISQRYDRHRMTPDDPHNFDIARAHGLETITALINHGWPSHIVMNVNFPNTQNVKGIKPVNVGRHKGGDDVEVNDGRYRIGMWRLKDSIDSQSDIGALLDGYITVCPLSLDMADTATQTSLKQSLPLTDA